LFSFFIATVGTFAVAMLATEFTEPFRLAAVFLTLPSLARLVGKAPKEDTPVVGK
jgi:hypothetical protein